MAILVLEVELQCEPCSARRLLCDGANGGLESRLFESVRVQLEDGLAQLPDRFAERIVGAIQLITLYSISPRRIVATAAPRSETPSFSYKCCTCVFTVVSPK